MLDHPEQQAPAYVKGQPVYLSELIRYFGGELHGADVAITQVAGLDTATATHLGFLSNPKYRKQLQDSAAGAVVLGPDAQDATDKPRIVVKQPYLYFARVSAFLNPVARPAAGVSAAASIAGSAQIDPSAHIAAQVTVGEGVRIGRRVVVHAGCRIGDGVTLGDDVLLYPNVVIYHDCHLGHRVIVHSGAVIGADGFGNAWDGEAWFKIPQIGRVMIADDVEIGASTTIDRGALGDTVIEEGVRLDNQIQIAHNCRIGRHTAMAGCVGVAGSTHIGAYCTFGGSAMILGHLEIADKVNVMAGTLVGKSILKAGTYVGQYPVQSHADWLANASHLRRLDALAQKVKELERQLANQTNHAHHSNQIAATQGDSKA